MLVGWTWSPLLKRRFRRGRPDLWAPLATETSHSFPSGHATMATIFFGAAGMALARLVPHPAGRLGILLAAALLILAVALSRVYLGVHWLSDVLAGILLGVVWLAVCLMVAGALASRPPVPVAFAPELWIGFLA